ncbi:MAG TPA: cytochrome P450, partial [Mycobacterium sp.]|nr:cytochrome P450 [Mycobacterium sp.]
MSEASTLDASVAGRAVLPPSPRVPRVLEALAFVANRRRTVEWMTRTHGRAVTVRVPVFGDSVLIADPVLAKQVFTTSPEVLHNIQP